MLKSYHAPLFRINDFSVANKIKSSRVRQSLDALVVEAPITLPGVDISLQFNQKYTPDDTMTFDFLRIKLTNGNFIPLERLYEVLGRKEISFQPENEEHSETDPFSYNHLMRGLFDQQGVGSLKVRTNDSRMFVWKPKTATKHQYVISTDNDHCFVPEHLMRPRYATVTEAWSAIRISPQFQSDGEQERVVHLSVSDVNPRRVGNQGRTVWENTTFSNALMLTSWYKLPNNEEEARMIYENVADVLNHTFPNQGYTSDNLDIKGENLEIYVKNRTSSMVNVDPVTNRILLQKADIVVMPIDDLK